MIAVTAVVHGRVQGVGFRWSTVQQADRLGLSGWVRNRPDGTVELLAQGAQQDVDQLLQWCRRGPSHAWVDRVDEHPAAADPSLQGFQVR